MADHEAFGALPKDHWIHKALAKTKKGGAKAPAGKAPVAKKQPAKPMAAENMNPGEYC